jgi:uncharacterized delta-60 repeat protein
MKISRFRLVTLAAVVTLSALSPNVALAAPGDLDPTFDDDGLVLTDFSGLDDSSVAVTVDAAARPIVIGSSFNGTDWDVAAARYDTVGALDTSFGSGGRTRLAHAGDDHGHDVVSAGDDAIIVGSTEGDFFIAEVSADGEFLSSFRGGYAPGYTYSGARQSDGSVVVVGSSPEQNLLIVERYRRAGAVWEHDPSFGTSGRTTITLVDFPDPRDVVLDAAGKIVIVGTCRRNLGSSVDADACLVRLLPDGTLDASFDGDGKRFTDLGTPADAGRALAIRPTGKILVVGYTCCGSQLRTVLAQHSADGALDPAFGAGGIVTTNVAASADDAVVQSDGAVVSVGQGPTWSVARFDPNGTLDAFGHRKISQFGSASATGVAVGPDGKVVVTGGEFLPGDQDFAVARFEGDPPPPPPPPSADGHQTTLANVPQEEGVLSIDVANTTVAFGELAPGGNSEAGVGQLFYTNTLAAGRPWSASVAATALGNDTGQIDYSNLAFVPGTTSPDGDGSISDGSPAPFAGSGTFSDSITLINAGSSDQGDFTQTGSIATLSVPAGTSAGDYTGTLQYTITG